MSRLRISDVSYSAGDSELLRSIDLTVDGGEMVAIIGPNGAGKSTLLAVVGGDLNPSSGFVEIAGRRAADLDYAELAELRAFLGADRTAGIPFSVHDVVAMGAWQRSPDGAAVLRALETMDVMQLSDRVVGSLSSGEHTRVELARVLIQDTPIVLLDEPLTALDVAHQEMVMQHLKGLTSEGRSMVIVLHDLNAAAAYADRVVLMSAGGVAAAGSPAEVFDAALLSRVYGLPMRVHSVAGRTVVLPAD